MAGTKLKPTFSAEVEKNIIKKSFGLDNLEFLRNYIADFPTDQEKLSFMAGVRGSHKDGLHQLIDINSDAYKIGQIFSQYSINPDFQEYPREIRIELSFIQAVEAKYYLEMLRCKFEELIDHDSDFDYQEAQNRLDSIQSAIEKNNEILALYKKGYIPGKTYDLDEITQTIDWLVEENMAYNKSIQNIQKSILDESQLRDKYSSDHHSLAAFYHAADMLKQNKNKLPWFNVQKRHSINKAIKEYEAKIFHQLEEIKKYDSTIGQYTTSDKQCQYLNEVVTSINEEIDIDQDSIENLKQSIHTNQLLIDKNTRDLKQYQIDTYGIPVDFIESVNDISESCSSTLVLMMKKANGERLEELRKHYYELVVNDDMYDGIYPFHLKRMQYPQDLIEAIKKIDNSNNCYDEARQIAHTTMLCKMVMNGVTLEKIMEHKDDVARDIENLYIANYLSKHSKPTKPKDIKMER